MSSDLTLFGATGFVGRLAARHLAAQAPPGLRVTLAGRSRERLEQVRWEEGRADWELQLADSSDQESLRELARSTRVVISTVGPYARHGMPLLEACAQEGTDYVDLTGEVLFVRDAIDRVHETAAATGARLVVSCGFDSMPSDLAVHLLHRAAQDDGAGGLTDTTVLVTRLRGGVSGGTVDSMREQLRVVHADQELARAARDPYALAPDPATEPRVPGQRDSTAVFVEQDTGLWTAPFLMASYNTRLVRRSHALARSDQDPDGYGARFRYRELMVTGSGGRGRCRAELIRAGLGALWLGLSTPGLSWLVDRVLPSPGEGPSPQQQAEGHFEMVARTTTEGGRRYVSTVGAQGDPGYAATSVMIGQAALALAVNGERCASVGGVLTPAVAMGDVLVDRLRDQGFTVQVKPD
ncbi:saccharopine dehydrogenase family protein [Ornithinimicrobium pratense]|uniref:NAD(P)H-binding protein n=1 Tax=Ornithinimicrobium pratense TaxID=2593973 RepID=A0A5J6V3R0_9MICO|nr:saccharopine dehydrogenase NADP-binding domain-containing protein [Ornithinimicrobium pratense]QFG68277.1 NAD(P)H-binding protein [Ornithinimicrobium pratense]